MFARLITFALFLAISIPVYAANWAVVDNQARGIEGAKITITGNGNSATVYSGAGGYFDLTHLPENMQSADVLLNFTVSKNGFITSQVSNFDPALSISITLSQQTYRLSGKVIDEAGNPMANVSIDAGALGSLSTDANGRFEINAPYGTPYRLSGSLVDYYLGEPVSGILEGDTERVLLALWE